MSIATLERIAHIRSRRELVAFQDRVSHTYFDGLMTTPEYLEYQRYIWRMDSRLRFSR